MKKIKEIYIIDDDPIHRLLMQKLFARHHHASHLSLFENGQKALDTLKGVIAQQPERVPDLILLDIEMPVMNGWQFMEAYQELDTKIKSRMALYIVSSSFSDEDQARVKNYPDIKEYIVKPIRIEKLNDLLK